MPTPQKLFCPHCWAILRFDHEQAGAVQECRWCNRAFRVPRLLPETESSAGFTDDAVGKQASQAVPLIPKPEEDWIEQTVAEVSAETRGNQARDDFFAEATQVSPRQSSSKISSVYPKQWQNIPTGLTLCQIGLVICSLMFLNFSCSGDFYRLMSPEPTFIAHPDPFFEPEMYREPLVPDLGGYLCGSVLGLVFVLLGQAICCAAPRPASRTPVVASTVMLLFFLGLLVFQLFEGRNLNGPNSGGFVLCSAIIMGISHVCFLNFLFDIFKHFRDNFGRRLIGFFSLSWALFVVGLLFLLCLIQPFDSYGHRSNDSTTLFLLLVCTWGISQWIFLFCLIFRAGSQIKKQLRGRFKR